MTIALVVLVAVLLWGALHLIRRLPMVLALSTELQGRIRSVLPALSLMAWLLYGIWAVNTLFPANVYATVLIVAVLSIVVLLFGWFVLRELVAGIVFSARHPALQGNHIQAAGCAGRVIRMGMQGISLRAEGGETVFLPYSALVGEVLVEHPPERSADEFRLRLAIPGDANGDAAADALKSQLLLSPWVNPVRGPSVQVSGSGRERVADVVYHCLSEEHALRVDELLRRTYRTGDAEERQEGAAGRG
jgi:small-conductance mechanosensitive channel